MILASLHHPAWASLSIATTSNVRTRYYTSAKASILAELQPREDGLKFSTLNIFKTWELTDVKCNSTYSHTHRYTDPMARVNGESLWMFLPAGPATWGGCDERRQPACCHGENLNTYQATAPHSQGSNTVWVCKEGRERGRERELEQGHCEKTRLTWSYLSHVFKVPCSYGPIKRARDDTRSIWVHL